MEITPEWLLRSELLLGSEKLQKLRSKNVLVVGLGGVGAYAAEMICRAGVGRMTIVDGDVVQPSNRNRQLVALTSTQGQPKAVIMEQRLRDINPDVQLTTINEFMRDEAMIDLLKEPYDYVVDAIDSLSPKIYLIYHSLQNKLPIISSMGSGGKLDPTKVHIEDLSKTYNCKLAYVLRKRLRKLGVTKGVKTIFSTEQVDKDAVMEIDNEQNKKSTVGTISYMPALFGCFIASVVIRDLIGEEDS
jgi:tRNA A37 threonylcarbamoyladenosine dehydratase